MKTNLWIPAIALMFFAACTKSSVEPMPVAAASAKGTTAIATTSNLPAEQAMQQAAISFRLTMERRLTPGILKWNSGYVSTSAIMIEGFQSVGNALTRQYAEFKAVQTLKLYGSADLGVLYLPYGWYNSFNLNVAMNPGNAADNNVLFLNGNYLSGNGEVQIELIVAEPLNLEAQIMGATKRQLSKPQYVASLTLNMDGLMGGVTSGMLDQATVANGVIVISSNSNRNLYQLITENLKASVKGMLE